MANDSIKAKLAEYGAKTPLDQENALQEIVQSCILVALSTTDFFHKAIFHGGTCLRIVNGLARFSEDLDFLLAEPDPKFSWQPYLLEVSRQLSKEGFKVEILNNKPSNDSAVKKAFVKTDWPIGLLEVGLAFPRHKQQKLKVKLEIDSNPPAGSLVETAYISFPVHAAITVQTLSSSFALKSHALLCRQYLKGRDWFDFLWYTARKIKPDLKLLENALIQQGQWKGKAIKVTKDWFYEELNNKIMAIDWKAAKKDVERFLPLERQAELELWKLDFFQYHLKNLMGVF